MSESSSQPWIVATTEESFERDVSERSHEVPVVVDFWAAWCQPCRMLAPLLEQLAAEANGVWVLVKANVDEVPEAAGRMGVQAIPAVFGLVDGEVVDLFQGLLSPDQLRGWLDRLVMRGALRAAERMETADAVASETRYRDILARYPNESSAAIGLARALAAQGRRDDARECIERLEHRGFLEPEAQKVRASLELAEMQGGDIERLTAQTVQHPERLELQLQLATALAGAKRFAEALERCLAIVQQQKTGIGDQARQVMVDIFRVLPEDSDLVREYRRQLTTALY